MKKKISFPTICAIVIANMIGTGVFTSLGFQLNVVHNTWTILLLWVSGGLLSLFGAFAYAELGTRYRESGGDYIYLSRVFHPLLGYLSAWAGLTVGFSAPVALAAIAFTRYLAPFGLQNNPALAIGIIIIITLMHSLSIRHSSRFQNLITLVKLGFIITLIIIGVFMHGTGLNAFQFGKSWQGEVITRGFAVSMIFVGFAYTGWNAAAYVAGEIDQPQKNLPKALIVSTLLVSVLYVLFQFVLLKHASAASMQNKEEVTFIAFNKLLGSTGGKWVSICIALQLVATISSYLWVGPRVTWAMAKENRLWRPLARTNSDGIPVAATWVHAFISIVLALTGSFERILLYAGFVLQLMSSLTVATSLFVRNDLPGSFRSPFKPVLQVAFLLFNAWVLVFTMADRPRESFIGIGILAVGAVLYYFDTHERMPDHEAPIVPTASAE